MDDILCMMIGWLGRSRAHVCDAPTPMHDTYIRVNAKIFKVDRKLNITAHVLANQAYNSTVRTSQGLLPTCTNPLHVNSCPLMTAINSVRVTHSPL
jgi:exonuclease I